ncbi:RING finger protein 44-like [Cynara cardunculus var. scolymus]|uniref:RING-type E3 ubiquitin transferase n=1 Tax=Cynara cardunculus var. scolymus TaxID=59895 RepID=A0A103XPV3_CYNCS|nr:RING finger protein 44-like [Cynara cardunculus var. scolymus]KVH94729.1 Zinc finger, RING/FYVE/PHD-type [Cynara cardunculus var. scolymus]
MDLHRHNASPPPVYHLYNTNIRAYFFFTINTPHPYHPHTLTRSLRYYHPLPYPYTWFVYGDQAAIINIIDLCAYYETHHQPPSPSPSPPHEDGGYDESITNLPYPNLFFDEDAILQHEINQGFQRAADNSGLTKEEISESLDIQKHMNLYEEDEICVICQAGFEKDETIGVVECNHRYHAECIKEWLIYKNLCPLCKAQALTIYNTSI